MLLFELILSILFFLKELLETKARPKTRVDFGLACSITAGCINWQPFANKFTPSTTHFTTVFAACVCSL